MPGEAYRVHDEVMAVLRAVEKLSGAWSDVERHHYLEEHATKIAFAASALAELHRQINSASTTPQVVVVRRPVLRVVR